MATEFQVAWGEEANLPNEYVPGRLLVTTDTKTIQLDTSEATRILLGQNLNLQNGAGDNSLEQTPAPDATDWTPAEGQAIPSGAQQTAEGNPLVGAFGDYSIMLGSKSQATGKRALAEGTSTIALGNYSHAEGNKTIVTGVNSHAEGLLTQATGGNSHAEGAETIASGDNSHAEGQLTQATGYGAHAEGIGSKATGEAAHAEGGSGNIASEWGAHAEGMGTKASGYASHAEGDSNTAAASASHAGGVSSQVRAGHDGTFVHGTGLISAAPYQTIIGQYNEEASASATNAAFIIGGGTNENRKNIFIVDKNGNAYSNNVKLQLEYQELDISSYEDDNGQYLINWLNSKEALVSGKYKTINPDDGFIYFIDIIEYNKNVYQTFLDGDEHIRYERWISYDENNEYIYHEWSIIADSALATGSTPGLVKIGAGLNIDDTGMLSTTEASNLFSMPYVVVTKDGTKESKGKIRVWAYNLQPLTTYKILLYTRSRRRGTHQGNWIFAKGLGYAKLAGRAYVSNIQPDPNDKTTWPVYEAIDTATMPWFKGNNGYITSEWTFTTRKDETSHNVEISVIDKLIKPMLKPSYSYSSGQPITFKWDQCGILGMSKKTIAPLLFQFKIQQDSIIYENYRYPSTLALGINSQEETLTLNPESGITSDQLYISIK